MAMLLPRTRHAHTLAEPRVARYLFYFIFIFGGFIFGDGVFCRRRLCMLGLHRAAFLMI